MKKIIYALRFLTILPIPWKEEENLKDVARSVAFFPLVGLILGGTISLITFVLLKTFTPLAIGAIGTVLWVIFTGGLHLDGLSDLFDSFGGQTREDRLKIMKDSTVGAFGALSLISLILLKGIFLREILLNDKEIKFLYIIIIPAWSRYFQILAIRFFKSARPDGLGIFFKKDIKNIDWIVPGIVMISLTAYLVSYTSLILIFIAVLVIGLFSMSISKKLGGLTGDCYGAVCEITEVLLLFLFAL